MYCIVTIYVYHVCWSTDYQYTGQLFSILKSANAAGNISPWSLEFARGAFMYPSEVGADCAVAAAVRSAGRALKGQDGEVFYLPAALDAGYLNQRGIETIMYGPGDLRFAHTDQEVVSLQKVRHAARIYAATALGLLT